MINNIINTVGIIQTFQIKMINNEMPPYSEEAKMLEDYLLTFKQFNEMPFPGVEVINKLSVSTRICEQMVAMPTGMSIVGFDHKYTVNQLYMLLVEFRNSILSKSNKKSLDNINKVKDLKFLNGIEIRPLECDYISIHKDGKVAFPYNFTLQANLTTELMDINIVDSNLLPFIHSNMRYKINNSNFIKLEDIIRFSILKDMNTISYMEEEYVKSIQSILK